METYYDTIDDDDNDNIDMKFYQFSQSFYERFIYFMKIKIVTMI